MSQQEVDRLAVIQSVVSKQLRQLDAAEQLGVSTRPVKRLVQRYRQKKAKQSANTTYKPAPDHPWRTQVKVAVMPT